VMYGGLTLLSLVHAVALCSNMASNDRDLMALPPEKGAQLYLGDDMHTTHLIHRIEGGLVRAKVSAFVEGILQAAQWVKALQDELDLLLAWAQCDVGQLIERFGLREVIVTRVLQGGYI